MVQPPWDKVVKQFWVYHLSVVGIDGPEHCYNKLEGKGNLLFQVHLLQHITGWLFDLKTQEFLEFMLSEANQRLTSKTVPTSLCSVNHRVIKCRLWSPTMFFQAEEPA